MTRYCFFAYNHALFPRISINVVTMLTRRSILSILRNCFVLCVLLTVMINQLITLSRHVITVYRLGFTMPFYHGLGHFDEINQDDSIVYNRSPCWLDNCVLFFFYLFQGRLSLYHQCNYVHLGYSFSYSTTNE